MSSNACDFCFSSDTYCCKRKRYASAKTRRNPILRQLWSERLQRLAAPAYFAVRASRAHLVKLCRDTGMLLDKPLVVLDRLAMLAYIASNEAGLRPRHG